MKLVELGPGRRVIGGAEPVICLPLVANNLQQAQEQGGRLAALEPDLIEVRLDFLPDLTPATTTALLKNIGRVCQGVPLLATFRRSEEGGDRPLEEPARLALLEAALESRAIRLLDVEFQTSPAGRDRLLSTAREAGVATIISYHDFDSTPPLGALAELVKQLASCEADILKLAVQPREPLDPINLLTVTYQATTTWLDRPLVTMAMGPLGSFTRLVGPFYGSAITFAIGEQSSAPGQLKIDIVKQLWQNWNVRTA